MKGAKQETEHRAFGEPDEIREFPKGRAEILMVGDAEIGRLIVRAGMALVGDAEAGRPDRQLRGAALPVPRGGTLAIQMDDGTEFVAKPGDVTSLPSGHDAWVVGDEPVVVVDWFGASNYAKAP